MRHSHLPRILPATLSLVLLGSGAAMAQSEAEPPADARPLSQIIASIEDDAPSKLAYVTDVEWSGAGYYEIEYRTTDRREVKVRIDPVTGQPR